MINYEEFQIFKDNISNLMELSKDDSDKSDIKYMTESNLKAINFDHVKTSYANKLGLTEEIAYSVDGIGFFVDNIMFTEFKNGKMKGEKANVKNKIRDSLLIFCDILNINISFTRDNLDFILVYNKEKNPIPNQKYQETESRVAIAEHFFEKAKTELIRFDLERFKTLYFREVHTYTEAEFEDYLGSLQ